LNVFFADASAPVAAGFAPEGARVALERDSLNVFFADASVPGCDRLRVTGCRGTSVAAGRLCRGLGEQRSRDA
jgi:hypothetical protein